MIRRLLVALLLLVPLAVQPGHAQNARAMRKQAEATMLVTGHVDIDREGRVAAHALDKAERLPPYVASLIGRAVPQLRFEPLPDADAPLARARMSLRLVATQAGDGNMKIGIRSAHFGDDETRDPASVIRSRDLDPPDFPASVARIGGKGTVYLLVKVGRDGKPEDVFPEQVNLTAVANAKVMESIRRDLSKAAMAGARRWRFTPPTVGDEASRDSWVVRVPVDFAFAGERDPGYGEWRAYVPGPRSRPLWALPDPMGFSPDTLVAGQVDDGISRFRLLTPLEG